MTQFLRQAPRLSIAGREISRLPDRPAHGSSGPHPKSLRDPRIGDERPLSNQARHHAFAPVSLRHAVPVAGLLPEHLGSHRDDPLRFLLLV